MWERTASYGFFAERYHWTPAQVDGLPWWFRDRLPGYAGIVDEVHEEHVKAANKT